MKMYANASDAYLAHVTNLRQLIGIGNSEYTQLTEDQRIKVSNNLLLAIKDMYDNTGKPSFLLYDFVVLRDACLLRNPGNLPLEAAVGKYIDNQVNYLAGYGALRSTLMQENFLSWLENASANDFPAAKVMCTSYHELSDNESMRRNINTAMLLQETMRHKDVLHHGIGVNNGVRLAALFDSGSMSESSRILLEKICEEVVRDIPDHKDFMLRWKDSEFRQIFNNSGGKYSLELEREKIQKALKQARKEAIKQQKQNAEGERVYNAQLAEQQLYQSHVADIEKANGLIAAHNVSAAAANAAAEKAAQHTRESNYYYALSESHRAAGARINQSIMGGGPVRNNISFSIGASAQNGLTVVANHSMYQGNRVIASASSNYNSVAAYNQKVSRGVMQAQEQAKLRAQHVPLIVREPLSELHQFIQKNSQHLQGFEWPQSQLVNPYTQQDSLLFQKFIPGTASPNNYGQSLIDKAYTMDRKAALNQCSDTSGMKIEPDNSTWNMAVNKFKGHDWLPEKGKSIINQAIDTAKDTAVTILTSSSAARANPMVLPATIASSVAVPGAISANNLPGKPPTFTLRQLGQELNDVGNKVALLSLMLTNPASVDFAHQILTTPVHETKTEDVVLPGGSKVDLDTSIPPTSAHDVAKELGKVDGVSTGPKLEDTSVPGYKAHDGDPLLFMFNGSGADKYSEVNHPKYGTWKFNNRIDAQLSDARLGELHGKLSKHDIVELAHNPKANFYLDNFSKDKHVNIIQHVDGLKDGMVLRITVVRDEMKLISVGIVKETSYLKYTSDGGRYVKIGVDDFINSPKP